MYGCRQVENEFLLQHRQSAFLYVKFIMSKISVIIASVNGLPGIDECLHALDKQQCESETEVIVVNRCQDGTAEHIRNCFRHVKLIEVSNRLSIPELRHIGMTHATGDIIVITEDHCIAPQNWLEEIRQAHESEYTAIGGAVENGSVERIIDWAAFFCEYSFAMPPVPRGEVESIAGNNASYKRAALEQVDDRVKKDYWEFFLHEEMRKSGVRFLSVPSIIVIHRKEFGFFNFLSQRFHYSRSFAAMRRARISNLIRAYYLLLSPLLPLLMLGRISHQVLSKRRFRREFALALPFLFVFMISYAAGEFVGYLLGSGDSLVKVE